MSGHLILIPYVASPHPAVLPTVHAEAPAGATIVPFCLEDRAFGYGRLLRHAWRRCIDKGDDLVVIEHDIVPPRGSLRAFASCEREWCAHSYAICWGEIADVFGGPYGLGCARFAASLMQRESDAMEQTLQSRIDPNRPPGYWGGLDGALRQIMVSRGYAPHEHFPPAAHLHTYDYTGAVMPPGYEKPTWAKRQEASVGS